MSTRLVKCYGTCGQKYLQSEMVKFRNDNHCPSCYAAKVKEVEDRENLYTLIKETFSLNYPSGLMLKQIKQFKEERNYTYRNIAFTIDFMTRLKGIKLQTMYGIALVPHYYDEMIRYYKDLKERREKTVLKKSSVIKIKMKPIVHENLYREKKMINMERLLENDSKHECS